MVSFTGLSSRLSLYAPVHSIADIFNLKSYLAQFADPLLRKFNLVVFDLRSHGETQGEDLPEGYNIKNAADDALALMVYMLLQHPSRSAA